MSTNNGFTENADLYRTSLAHSELPDLEECIDALPTVSGLEILDVATGTGHTAFYFSRKQAHTFAVDINKEMLQVAEEEAERQSLSVRFLYSAADDLNFDDNTFDIVCCRLATHHFPSVGEFLNEACRVLRSGGHVLIIDNVVPDDDSETAQWLNAYEKERDPTHQSCLTPNDWTSLFQERGLESKLHKRFKKTLLFDPWMKRMSKSDEEMSQSWETLLNASEAVQNFWKPKVNSDGEKTLRLQRQLMVVQKP